MNGGGVYVWDSPGVMVPKVDDPERGLRLALLGCVRSGAVDHITLARYLLHQCNTGKSKRNWERGYGIPFGLSAPTWDIDAVLEAAKARLSGTRTASECARYWVSMFQKGELGPWTLEDPDGKDEGMSGGVIVDMEAAANAITGLGSRNTESG